MTSKELKIILNKEKEFWNLASYYQQEALNNDMSEEYRKTALELHHTFRGKWCAIYDLIEELGMEI